MISKSAIRTSLKFSTKSVPTKTNNTIGKMSPFDIQYGPPSRMANSGFTVTAFGAYGFMGRYLASDLGDIGTRLYAPFRGCEMETRILKPMFDHGQLALMPFSTRDDQSIIDSIKHSDVVVNFIGKHYETKHVVPTRRENGSLSRINFDFEEVNVTIPRKLAKLAKQNGIKTFIHVSALSADLDSASVWSQTKARGEIAVREEFPEAIIIRPSTVFGHEDQFLNVIATVIETFGVYPVINEGKTLLQPVYVNDISKAIMKIIFDWKIYQGKTFQLAGPTEYTFKEIVEFVSDVITRRTAIVTIPLPLATASASFLEQLINPVVTVDQIKKLGEDNILLDNPELLTFKTLDIEPASMDRKAFDYLYRFRPGGHFTKVAGYHSDLKV